VDETETPPKAEEAGAAGPGKKEAAKTIDGRGTNGGTEKVDGRGVHEIRA